MYRAPIYYMVGSSYEDDSTRSGPTIRGVGSVRILKGLGGVGPTYGFRRNPFTLCNRISSANVPSVNVLFSTTTIQYDPVQRKRSFLGIFPMRVWNTSTTLPTPNIFSVFPWCRFTKAFLHCYSCSRIARLRTRISLSARSCCSRTCSDIFSSNRPLTWMCKLGI